MKLNILRRFIHKSEAKPSRSDNSNYPELMKQRIAYLLGNGPSLRGFDFVKKLNGRITFGMNLAFRYWNTINWYPTYYSCLDKVVGMHHLASINDLIVNRHHNGIRAFCLRHEIIQELNLENTACVYDYEKLLERYPFYFRSYWASTGSSTLAWASWLGYRNIIMLGIEGTYVKYVQNARHISDIVLKLEEQPQHNPNYFFDSYQQAGDVYHVPVQNNPDFPYEDQMMGWHMLKPQLAEAGTLVVNANPQSKVDAFPKSPLKKAPSLLRGLRKSLSRLKRQTSHVWTHIARPGTSFDILGLAFAIHGARPGILLDVGSFQGNNCRRALKKGWKVIAAEADEVNRTCLFKTFQNCEKLQYVEPDAVSCISGREYPWYHSTCDNWSAMRNVTGTAKLMGTVKTVTIKDILIRAGVEHIDILALDIMGFEFMALRGIPFPSIMPGCIVASWNDDLSLQLGYSMHDMGAFLLAMGYTVYMSEWQSSEEKSGQWLALRPYPARTGDSRTYGHFIAFRKPPSFSRFDRALRASIHSAAAFSAHALPPLPPVKRPAYAMRF